MYSQSLSLSEQERYSRHLVIPEVGIEGQLKLKAAKVLVVGAGGLGAPLIQYLAAAGVGTIGIVDFDYVDISNLQRQVLFDTNDIGKAKVLAAAQKVAALNPEVTVIQHAYALTASNVVEIFAPYSVIVDGTDNFETRYLISDACVLMGKVNVHAAVHRFYGQIGIYSPGLAACYRCFFANPPVPGSVANCEQAGVLGILPGIVGSIQAAECLKVLLSLAPNLIGRLMVIDALEMTFKTLQTEPDPSCIACGDNRDLRTVADLLALHSATEGCVQSVLPDITGAAETIEPAELKAMISSGEDFLLLDVREKNEFEFGHISNSRNVPLSALAEKLNELPSSSCKVIVYCKSGARSAKAVELLRQTGKSSFNLRGGLSLWSQQIDKSVKVL